METGISVLDHCTASPVIPPASRPRLVAVGPIERRSPAHALKILAPIDFSVDPRAPVEQAINVARAIGADLMLLNVADPRSRGFGWPQGPFDRTLPGHVDKFIVPGSVPETIASFAEFVDADLVLMISEHYGRWTRFWKWSVTAHVMESTDRPVLVTGLADTDSRFHCRRILCALTLDGTDGATVLQAEALARRSGGEPVLLSAVPDVSEGLLYEAIFGADRPLSTCLALDRLREIPRGLSVPYKTSVMIGSPHKCIGLAAQEYAADIVVAARAKLDVRALFRGLTCPMLSIARKSLAVCPIGAGAADSLPELSKAAGF
jgi:nucleotide-binding universal stress UspA family protein